MMKRSIALALILLVCSAGVLMASGETEGPVSGETVTLQVWTDASVSEAPVPPEDWIGYTQIKDKLNI